jgi:uncharacterized cofD-like protein
MPAKTFVKKKVVCIGGGTGASTVINALNGRYDLSAIVAMFDSGCSTGQLRREFNLPPMGDLRQCLISLAKKKEIIPLMRYRFEKGFLKGHSLGNILLAAAAMEEKGIEQGLEKLEDILETGRRIFPITLANSNLAVVLKNGRTIKGEEEIVNCSELSKVGAKKIFLFPKAKANPKALAEIEKADFIIIGPGKFYTSLISNFLAEGFAEAIKKSKAKKILICNLMTQPGNTDDFTVEKFLSETEKYLGKDSIGYVIFNTQKIPSKALSQVSKIFPGSRLVGYGPEALKEKNLSAPICWMKNCKN